MVGWGGLGREPSGGQVTHYSDRYPYDRRVPWRRGGQVERGLGLSAFEYTYTPYEGLNLANQNNRKLEVFGRKLEETSQNCIDILINISKIETILFN